MVLRIGLVGCGGISVAHRSAMKRQDGAAFVAFCDRDIAKARAAADSEGAAAYADVEPMLELEQLDGLVVCTPPDVRTEVFAAAASRKLPVLCEKPPALTVEAARSIKELIREPEMLVSVAFLFRYLPIVERLRKLIDNRPAAFVRSRYVGDVANNSDFRQSKPWYFLKEKSGGPVLDQAIHVLDLIRFLFGDADQVVAQGQFRTRELSDINTTEDTVLLMFTTHSGVLVSHCHCWGHNQWSTEVEVTGADYTFVLDLQKQSITGIDRGERVEVGQPSDGFELEQTAWLEAIRNGDRSLIRSTYADAAQTLALCLTVNRSMESGKAESVESL